MKFIPIFLILLSSGSFAQQEPITGMYWNNYSYYNPAMSGVKYRHEGNVIWRNQWDQVNGAPNNLFVNYAMNVADRHGVGINYMYGTIGFTRINQVKVNYNYQVKLGEDRTLVVGTAIGYQHLEFTDAWIPPTNAPDLSLPMSKTYSVNADMGVSYYGEKLMAGIGVTQLTLMNDPLNSGYTLNYPTLPHLFGNLRYELGLSPHNNHFILETKFRTDFVKYSQEFNVGCSFNDLVEAGVGYRLSDAILINITGTFAKKFRIGYLYEITTNKLASVSRGSHEIALGVRIGK